MNRVKSSANPGCVFIELGDFFVLLDYELKCAQRGEHAVKQYACCRRRRSDMILGSHNEPHSFGLVSRAAVLSTRLRGGLPRVSRWIWLPSSCKRYGTLAMDGAVSPRSSD
jgi:hypothetical protein